MPPLLVCCYKENDCPPSLLISVCIYYLLLQEVLWNLILISNKKGKEILYRRKLISLMEYSTY